MKKRLLMIDDDILLRQELTPVLENTGISVTAVGCGEDSLCIASKEKFDVALVDIRLPDGEGVDLIPRLKRHRPDAVYLIMTAYGSVESVTRALRYGVFDYIFKPFQIDDLLRTVRRAFVILEENDVREKRYRRWVFERDVLLKKIDVLRRLNQIYLEREQEVRGLKREVNDLLQSMNRTARYKECLDD